MNNENKIKYPRKSKYTDRTSSITSIINSNMMYLLRFAADPSEDIYEDKHSFRYIKIVNNEAWITPLLQSQFRRSVQYNDVNFLKRRWNYYLRLK
jgi:hypothetical protein